MSFSRRYSLILVFLFAFECHTFKARADIVTHTLNMDALQNVNLLGIDAVLFATGPATFTFDVDANNNTIPGGNSSVTTLFTGVLPAAFAPLGVAGAPFELFPNLPNVLQATGNGTHVRVEATFGIRVYVAPGVVGANFFTAAPSIFQSNVIGLQNFNGSVFQDPLRPNDAAAVFIGANALGIAPGTQVGVSFNRTVAAVPEPSALWISLSFFALVIQRNRKS